MIWFEPVCLQLLVEDLGKECVPAFGNQVSRVPDLTLPAPPSLAPSPAAHGRRGAGIALVNSDERGLGSSRKLRLWERDTHAHSQSDSQNQNCWTLKKPVGYLRSSEDSGVHSGQHNAPMFLLKSRSGGGVRTKTPFFCLDV